MALGTGLASQIGIVKESVVNTPVAVTNFTRFNTESLEARPQFAQSSGLGGSNLTELAINRVLTGLDAGGDVEFHVPTKGFGKWLQMIMGSAPTATQISSSTAYGQLHNLGSADGTSWTIQKGAPSIDGTLNPFTYGGCKAIGAEISCAPNGLATVKVTVDAMSVQPTGAGALGIQTASYSATTALYGFNAFTVKTFSALTTVSGLWTPTTPADIGVVRNISLKFVLPKKTDRWQEGSTTKTEQLTNGFAQVTGQLDIDYASNALYTQFVANTSTGIFIQGTGADAGSGNLNTLQFVLPACFWEQGSTPKVSGPDVVTVGYPFTAKSDITNGAVQGYIISTDATV